LSEELLGREVAQSLVGTDGIVGSFPGFEFSVELGDGERASIDLIESLGVSTVGPLDPAVEFGRAGRQHE